MRDVDIKDFKAWVKRTYRVELEKDKKSKRKEKKKKNRKQSDLFIDNRSCRSVGG